MLHVLAMRMPTDLGLMATVQSDPHTTATMENDKVIITGILTDKLMTVEGQVGKMNTVEWALRKLKPDVAQVINKCYDLQPPLDADSMSARYFPSSNDFSCGVRTCTGLCQRGSSS